MLIKEISDKIGIVEFCPLQLKGNEILHHFGVISKNLSGQHILHSAPDLLFPASQCVVSSCFLALGL